jgi:hypothetical protein
MHPAVAGAIAATTWGLLEPIDRGLFRNDYSDIALLGKTFTRTHWRPVGFAVHALNGAIFGIAVDQVCRRTEWPARRLAIAAATIEHLTLFPLGGLVDRYHPARGEPGVVGVFSARAFGQATLRHLVFGLVLGALGPQDSASRPGHEAGLHEER